MTAMVEPKFFRKKPIDVPGMQWDGSVESTNALYVWTGAKFRVRHDDGRTGVAEVFDKLHDTWVELYKGDWILRGVQGEFYPCRNDVLAATYYEVERPPNAATV
jgi:hypothetical protein